MKTKLNQDAITKLIVIITWIISFALYAFILMDNTFVMTVALALIFVVFSIGTIVLK